MSTCPSTASLTLLKLPDECQVHILSFLRAFDLGPLQQTCKYYRNEDRIDKVVKYFAQHVYGPEFTKDIVTIEEDAAGEEEDAKKPSKTSVKKTKKGGKRKANLKKPPPASSQESAASSAPKYTLQHLRAIELTVVARVLSLPEPKTGFYVSKSWIKKTLLWLEAANEPLSNATATANGKTPKKLSKKQQRQRNRRLSDVSPPWPNANSDILCEHQNLQRLSTKSARSRRKLMDKHSWKVLRKLYPDSTALESHGGECLQCLMESEAAKKTESDRKQAEMLERKKPLANPHVRRFYTRTKGVPTQCLVENSSDVAGTAASAAGARTCPLMQGQYVILPRAWCHQWRRYMKTGEGSMPLPPESSALLCDAHKLALLPPHLEAFLSGETPQLFASVHHDVIPSPAAAAAASPMSPVGLRPTLDLSVVNSLMAAGVSQAELAAQQEALRQVREEQQQAVAAARAAAVAPPATPRRESSANNELLDRENHVVVELVSQEEWTALRDTGCWPKQVSHYSVTVDVDANGSFGFSTLPCRDCDPSGLRFMSCASVKNKFRSKRWEPKSVEQKRIPNLEY